MYFSRITLPLERLAPSQLAHYNARGDGPHHLIWRAFEHVGSPQLPCVYRYEPQPRALLFYAVSPHEPSDWEGRFQVETRRYTPQLAQGQRLSFTLRANAVVSRSRGPGQRGQRHDVVMDYKRHHVEALDEMSEQEIIEEAGRQWLTHPERAARHGARWLQVSVDGYRQHELTRRGQRARVQFSTLEFSGTLEVVDAARLKQTLYEGLGSAKGYGNGLLLVRPR